MIELKFLSILGHWLDFSQNKNPVGKIDIMYHFEGKLIGGISCLMKNWANYVHIRTWHLNLKEAIMLVKDLN